MARKKTATVEPPGTKKLVVDVPQRLAQDTEALVSELHTTTSSLVRAALEKYIADFKQQKFERQLEEGYVANAELSAQIHAEFAHVDADAWQTLPKAKRFL